MGTGHADKLTARQVIDRWAAVNNGRVEMWRLVNAVVYAGLFRDKKHARSTLSRNIRSSPYYRWVERGVYVKEGTEEEGGST